MVVFQASAINVSLSARNSSAQQTLSFAVENVTGLAQWAIDNSHQDKGTVESVNYEPRIYLDDDGPPDKHSIGIMLA